MENNNFEEAIDYLFANEGGFVNDPDDGGGKTKFGISKQAHPAVDIENLSEEEAKEIYKKIYWDSQRYNEITHTSIVVKLFDLVVNVGPFWGHKIIQRALRAMGHRITEDGILGTKTIEAINNIDPEKLIIAIKSEAAGYYRCIATSNPKSQKFLNGWLSRAYK